MASFLRRNSLGQSGMPVVPEIPYQQLPEQQLINSEEDLIVDAPEEGLESTANDDQLPFETIQTSNVQDEELKKDATLIHELLAKRIHQPPTVAEGKRRQSIDRDPRNHEGTAIVTILCARSDAQRQEIARAYFSLYKEDLATSLKTFTGEFHDLLQALMETPTRYDASQLHRAITSTSHITGMSTKDSTLIEILCTRDNEKIQKIKSAYRQMFGSYLEHDISKVTWSNLMHLFMWLTVGARDQSTNVDLKVAHEDAQALRKGEEGVGLDATLYNVVLTMQNYAQLRAVFVEYEKIACVDIEKAVESEFSGDHKVALLALIMFINDKLPIFFAHRLHHALHSLSSHDTTLIRLLVTRSEIDLEEIKQYYEQIYHKTLEVEIMAYCSGVYREGLFALLRKH